MKDKGRSVADARGQVSTDLRFLFFEKKKSRVSPWKIFSGNFSKSLLNLKEFAILA